MAPFICGLRWLLWKRSVTKIALSQQVFEITRDFKFFSTENFKAVYMKSATSANRPAKLAKSAIFWMKPNFFLKKLENDPNSSQIMSAGSGRCIKSWPEICSASPKATSTYSECTKVCFTCLFMKQNVSHKIFVKKIAPKLKKNIHIFSKVNPLEKIEKKKKFSSFKFGNFVFKK